ncbi:MAG: hypothetical protein AAFQ51_14480, partial [Pseudomonadota bacterium]
MKHILAAACAVIALPATAQPTLDAESAAILQEGLTVTAEEFIVPGYAEFAAAAERMTGATRDYCAGTGALEAAREGFAETFLAWQR